MKKGVLLFLAALIGCPATACVTCNRQIQNGIYNSTFYPNLLLMLSAFIVLGILVTILSVLSARSFRNKTTHPLQHLLNPAPLTTAAMVLGIGLGGFIDGIVFHQILQWHEMLSNKISATDYLGKSINMFWDGIFHAFCLVVVLIGVVLLWKLLYRTDVHRSGKILAGGLLTGWGWFNIIEGLIDHHFLKLHNVMEFSAQPDIANFSFLGISLLMLLTGHLLIRKGAASLHI